MDRIIDSKSSGRGDKIPYSGSKFLLSLVPSSSSIRRSIVECLSACKGSIRSVAFAFAFAFFLRPTSILLLSALLASILFNIDWSRRERRRGRLPMIMIIDWEEEEEEEEGAFVFFVVVPQSSSFFFFSLLFTPRLQAESSVIHPRSYLTADYNGTLTSPDPASSNKRYVVWCLYQLMAL